MWIRQFRGKKVAGVDIVSMSRDCLLLSYHLLISETPIAAYFGGKTVYREVLARAEELYGVPFDDAQWQVERAKDKVGETELDPLS